MNVNKEFAVSIGMRLYHTTNVTFDMLADRPTWFTPCRNQATGYRTTFANSRTLTYLWTGGEVATVKDAMSYVLQIWPDFEDDEPMYSMFDESIGEWPVGEVRVFIKLLERAGFVGAVHRDYSSLNSDEDAYTLVVFHPSAHLRAV